MFDEVALASLSLFGAVEADAVGGESGPREITEEVNPGKLVWNNGYNNGVNNGVYNGVNNGVNTVVSGIPLLRILGSDGTLG